VRGPQSSSELADDRPGSGVVILRPLRFTAAVPSAMKASRPC
jgi:hypothetical protein